MKAKEEAERKAKQDDEGELLRASPQPHMLKNTHKCALTSFQHVRRRVARLPPHPNQRLLRSLLRPLRPGRGLAVRRRARHPKAVPQRSRMRTWRSLR